jgi:hypothetical protein
MSMVSIGLDAIESWSFRPIAIEPKAA